MQDGIARFYYESLRKHTAASEFAPLTAKELPMVALVYLYGGIDSNVLHSVLQTKPHGLVLAGLGHGILPERIRQLVENLDIPVVRSSRTGSGMVSAMPNDSRHGFIVSDTLAPSKARILLTLGLTKTKDRAALQEYFTNINASSSVRSSVSSSVSSLDFGIQKRAILSHGIS